MPCLSSLWYVLAFFDLRLYRPKLQNQYLQISLLYLHITFSSLSQISLCLSPIRTHVIYLGSTRTLEDNLPISRSLSHLQRIFFPNRVTVIVSRDSDLISLGMGAFFSLSQKDYLLSLLLLLPLWQLLLLVHWGSLSGA